MQLLTTIEPVLAACATLNCVFCGFGLVADGAFVYGRHVTEVRGMSMIRWA